MSDFEYLRADGVATVHQVKYRGNYYAVYIHRGIIVPRSNNLKESILTQEVHDAIVNAFSEHLSAQRWDEKNGL